MSEPIEMIDEATENAPQQRTSTPGERAAVAERVALHRARKAKAKARELVLSEKQQEKIQAATSATFGKVYGRLTAEQKLALEAESEEAFPNLRQICDMMYEVVALCDLEMFKECRPDVVKEFYDEFTVEKFPFAKDLVLPRAWYADRDYRNDFIWYVARHVYSIKSEKQANGVQQFLIEFDEDAPVQFSLDQFFSAVKKYRKWQNQTPNASAIVEDEPIKRGRGRLKKSESKSPTETAATVDPTEVAKWFTPPSTMQAERWRNEADRSAAIALKRQVEDALPSKPVVFIRQNEQ